MIIKPIHSYYIDNEDAVKIENNELDSPEGEIYEVIRISDGIPLFVEDHIDRFFNSASLAGLVTGLCANNIENRIKQLITITRVNNGNIRFSFLNRFRAIFIPHTYPGEADFKEGVPCRLLHTERVNPQAKTMQVNIREAAGQLIKETGCYEVLLVDHDNHVTEGSRSNVFFVRNNCFYTPSSSDVLPGTTRKRIIALIGNLGWPLVEGKINVSNLPPFEAAFITGTSPKILPINKIENYSFRTDNLLMRELMKKYDELVDEYLRNTKYLRIGYYK